MKQAHQKLSNNGDSVNDNHWPPTLKSITKAARKWAQHLWSVTDDDGFQKSTSVCSHTWKAGCIDKGAYTCPSDAHHMYVK